MNIHLTFLALSHLCLSQMSCDSVCKETKVLVAAKAPSYKRKKIDDRTGPYTAKLYIANNELRRSKNRTLPLKKLVTPK